MRKFMGKTHQIARLDTGLTSSGLTKTSLERQHTSEGGRNQERTSHAKAYMRELVKEVI